MKLFNCRKEKTLRLFCLILLSLLMAVNKANAQIDESQAEELVKNSPCIDNQTIDEALKDKIRIRSQRDLGWQVFKEEDQYEVERAFLMNKSMQLRFRWHVNVDGSISPVGKRAESLCSK
jgi:hypothetical protein